MTAPTHDDYFALCAPEVKRRLLAAAARGAAVVIVAHRAGVLPRVDRLVSIRDGVIQHEGPREEVLTKLRAAPAPTNTVRPS